MTPLSSIQFYLLLLLCIFTSNACTESSQPIIGGDDQKTPPNTLLKKLPPTQPYANFLQEVQAARQNYLKNGNRDSLKKLFFLLINKDLPRYWGGTKWDFNGMTRKPNQGNIACGYFITNTLTDIGFNIPRIKLAQLPSSKMIHALCTNVETFPDFEALLEYLEGQSNESVFIIGLDFHTGYVTKDGRGEVYFIHSNYIEREGVVKELAKESVALQKSNFYMIGNLSANKQILQDW